MWDIQPIRKVLANVMRDQDWTKTEFKNLQRKKIKNELTKNVSKENVHNFVKIYFDYAELWRMI